MKNGLKYPQKSLHEASSPLIIFYLNSCFFLSFISFMLSKHIDQQVYRWSVFLNDF